MAAVWFCYFAAIGAFNPYAPLWFKELGFSTLAIGSIASLQSWTRVVAPYGWGWLGDHRGHRVPLIRLAAASAAVAAVGLLWAREYTTVALVTVAVFLANGGVVPLSEAMLARFLRTEDGIDTARYGRIRVWGSVGFIVAVVLFGAVLERVGIGWFPGLVLAMYLLLLAAAMRLPSTPDQTTVQARSSGVWRVLARPAVAWFFASVFFTVLAHTALYAFFSLYLVELGHGKAAVGLFWGVSVVVEILFFWFQGRFFDRADPHRWLQRAAAVAALRFALIAALGAHAAVLLFAQALHALTFAGQHAACIVLINRWFPSALRGRGQALYTVLGYGLSGVIGGVGGGWISSRWGYAAVFWAAALSAAVGWWCASRSRARDAEAARML